jgi:Tfp pilus assembly protein FimT
MRRRSLTLLETLIALTLVLAMAALIIPSMLSSMEERSFEAASDVTKEQLMMARAHAQATGNPVEVTYRPDTSQVRARWFMPWMDEDQTSSMEDVDSKSSINALGLPNRSAASNSHEPHRNEITEPWATRDIGRSIRIASHPPDDAASDASELNPPLAQQDVDQGQSGFEELEKGEEVRLAIFMPDGSALMGEPVWLNDDKGRCGKFIINPWSGLPIFERLGDLADKSQKTSLDKSKTDREADKTGNQKSLSAHSDDSSVSGGGALDSDESAIEDEFGRGD